MIAPAVTRRLQRRDTEGFLFRIKFDGPVRVLVQSVQKPDWTYAFQNAPWLLRQPRVWDPSLQPGQTYRFRLLAHMVHRQSKPHPSGQTRTTASGRTVVRGKPIFTGGLFEGTLRCTNTERLSRGLIDGMGTAKAFGFGLLSLARLND